MRLPGRAPTAATAMAMLMLFGTGSCHSTAGSNTVTIKQFAFGPHRLVIHAGQVVTVVNHDQVLHGFTADDGSIDVHSITAGSSTRVTFSRAGMRSYHCPIHVSMTGVIDVR